MCYKRTIKMKVISGAQAWGWLGRGPDGRDIHFGAEAPKAGTKEPGGLE